MCVKDGKVGLTSYQMMYFFSTARTMCVSEYCNVLPSFEFALQKQTLHSCPWFLYSSRTVSKTMLYERVIGLHTCSSCSGGTGTYRVAASRQYHTCASGDYVTEWWWWWWWWWWWRQKGLRCLLRNKEKSGSQKKVPMGTLWVWFCNCCHLAKSCMLCVQIAQIWSMFSE